MTTGMRIYIDFTDEEIEAIRAGAERTCREPRQFIRFVLRQALGLDVTATENRKAKSADQISDKLAQQVVVRVWKMTFRREENPVVFWDEHWVLLRDDLEIPHVYAMADEYLEKNWRGGDCHYASVVALEDCSSALVVPGETLDG